MQIQSAASGILKPAMAVLTIGFLSSCVAQTRYDEAEMAAKKLEQRYFEVDRERAALESENLRLKRQLEASKSGLEDASFSDIDKRLATLGQTVAELGKKPGDVTKFETADGYGYNVKDSILFPLASADVSPEGREVLKTLAADISSRPDYKTIWVRGHTDNVPVVKTETLRRFPYGNLQLSAARAIEVAGILIKEGQVDPARIVILGFGPNEPKVDNSSPENRQINRRVEIFVTERDN
jgi:chemotaxis protein MotB